MPNSIIGIKRRIADIENQLADLEARLPAHSIPTGLIAEMDQLEQQIQSEKKILADLLAGENNG